MYVCAVRAEERSKRGPQRYSWLLHLPDQRDSLSDCDPWTMQLEKLLIATNPDVKVTINPEKVQRKHLSWSFLIFKGNHICSWGSCD